MNKDWLDIGILEDYLDGKLDARAMNRVERESLEDPFVAEALAGLSQSPKRSLQFISLLQKQLQERITEQQSVKKASVITWQRLSIAATAAVLFITISTMFWLRENNNQKELAGRPKNVEVNLAPLDSVKSPAIAAAPQIPAATVAKDLTKEKELEKAIKAAKTNSYAVRAKDEPNILRSEAAASQELNEVVVVGYGSQKKQSLTGSVVQQQADTSRISEALTGRVAGLAKKEIMIRGMATPAARPLMVSNPVDGWDKLFSYINTNNSFAKAEKTGQAVELSFRIAEDGSPTDVQITQHSAPQYEAEAIRLLLNGPKWEQPKKADSRMTFRIGF